MEQTAIDRNSPLPLYYQVKQQIIAQVENGILIPGEPLPAETTLCTRFNVSRTTVRQAVNELVTEGYIYKVKNVGKYIAAPKLHSDFLDLYKVRDIEFSDLTTNNVTMEVMDIRVRPASAKEAKYLQIPENENILYLLRRRRMGNTIAYYIESHLIDSLCHPLLTKENLENNSLYEILHHCEETRLGSIRRELEACTATEQECKLLEIPANSPILLCKNFCYTLATEKPIVYDVIRYAGKRNKLSLTVKMDSMY